MIGDVRDQTGAHVKLALRASSFRKNQWTLIARFGHIEFRDEGKMRDMHLDQDEVKMRGLRTYTKLDVACFGISVGRQSFKRMFAPTAGASGHDRIKCPYLRPLS